MKKLLISLLLAAAVLPLGAQGLKTGWADKVNPAKPLAEYPRPQMVRSQWQSLNGMWNYAITSAKATTFKSEGQILVPFAVESSLSKVGRTVGQKEALWYERTFSIPKEWKKKRILLHFDAVDWKAEVWVNGSKVGEHTGGYTQFAFDITPYIKGSKQTLRVKVQDGTDNSYQPHGKQNIVPAGIWYTPVTGIWQSVWMEPVEDTRIDTYNTVADLEKGTLSVSVETLGVRSGDEVKIDVLESPSSGKVIASAKAADGQASILIPDFKTWSPDSPYLYGLSISVIRAGKTIDNVKGYAAMRTISVVKDKWKTRRLALNGKILFQYGPLDQGWWPDGLYTAPTDEALKFDIQKTKDFGFNMIRKHIKIEPARWYYWCDVLGMLVWQDMPCIADYDRRDYRDEALMENTCNKWAHDSMIGGTDCTIPDEWKANYYKEWSEIIAQRKMFPCIVVWVPFNEGWGQFDTPEVVAFTRNQDPTRLVNESSGGNFHLCGDILDEHHYPFPAVNVYEGKMVNVLGEYGGIGYPVSGHLWKQDKNWGYGKVQSSGEDVLKIYTEYAERLKDFIKTGCSAAVYTQTTDVEIEVNGLMTYDRAVIKMDEKKLREVNLSVIESLKD